MMRPIFFFLSMASTWLPYVLMKAQVITHRETGCWIAGYGAGLLAWLFFNLSYPVPPTSDNKGKHW